jgi:hypothetical protein
MLDVYTSQTKQTNKHMGQTGGANKLGEVHANNIERTYIVAPAKRLMP